MGNGPAHDASQIKGWSFHRFILPGSDGMMELTGAQACGEHCEENEVCMAIGHKKMVM